MTLPHWAARPDLRWCEEDGTAPQVWDLRSVYLRNGEHHNPPPTGHRCMWSARWLMDSGYITPPLEKLSDLQIRFEFLDALAIGRISATDGVLIADMAEDGSMPGATKKRVLKAVRAAREGYLSYLAPWVIYKRLSDWDSVPIHAQKLYSKPKLRKAWAPDGLADLVGVRPPLLRMHKRKTLPRTYKDDSEDNRILRLYEELMETTL